MDRARRLYRLLLLALPPSVREERGALMEALFADMVRERHDDGRRLGPGFWLTAGWDVAQCAAREWVSLLRYETRSATAVTMGEHMSALWGDVRYAVRQLVRQPVYALTVIVLMAVGIAGNAAVFRVVNGLFIRPLPFEESERLVDLDETAPQWDLEYLSIAYRDFDRWRAENGTFEAMTVLDYGGGNATIEGSSDAIRVSFLQTTHDVDEVLRIEPLIGRFYGPEEDSPDGPRGGLLSMGFWEQQFDSDPGVLGKTININGFAVEIIGVLPPEARFVSDSDMWLPLRADPADFDGWGLNGIGRLKPDATIEQARDDLMGIHKAMTDEFEVNEISSPVISSMRDRYLGDYRLGSGFLMGAVAVVLLIACANIAGLMLARSFGRAQEMSVRAALGAPRSRLVRQLLTESVVLAAVGAGLGLALGVWGSQALVAPMADQFPRWVVFDLDAGFLLFTAVITAAAALLFGMAPALKASSSRPTGASRTTRSLGRRRAMAALVTGEVALALTLLVVGGLAVVDVRELGRADPGFDAEGLIAYNLALPAARYGENEERLAFVEAYLDRLEAIPGVESAAVTSGLPLSGHWGWFYQVENAPPRGEDVADPVVLNRIVSPGYFETAGVEFVAGRPLDDFDGRERDTWAVVVNETFVRTHMSHLEDPIGARVTPGTDIGDDPTWMTVVGVARDVKHYGVDEEMRPGVYQPLRQLALQGFQVALRVRAESGPIISAARSVTGEMDSELPLFNVLTMTDELDESLWTRRAISWLIAAFSTVALILAVAGIYGVISYNVGQRTREISIRMAVGAQRSDVLQQVVRQGMALVGVGTLVGLAISYVGAEVVSGILVGVEATDLRVYGAVTLLLVVVAGLANYIPARRAARMDPMGALRRE